MDESYDNRTGRCAGEFTERLPADFVVRDFDLAAAGSEIVFDRVQATSDLALIERTRRPSRICLQKETPIQ
jgi:hypothetical protein